jgi:flavin reductase (DIM6/NTAB) family NADH-FMN oxidoreductase RutF
VPTDPVSLRSLYSSVPQSVVAMCGIDDAGIPAGVAASSFTPISLDPPLVSVAMAHTSSTWPVLKNMSRLGLSLLSESQGPICRQLAAQGGHRFAGIDWRTSDNGAVFIDGAAVALECELFDELPAGDHTIILLLVKEISIDGDREPLIFHGSDFRRLAAALETRSAKGKPA